MCKVGEVHKADRMYTYLDMEGNDQMTEFYRSRQISIFDILGYILNPTDRNKISNMDKRNESVLFAIFLFHLYVSEKLSAAFLQYLIEKDYFSDVFIKAYEYMIESPEKCVWIIENNYFQDEKENFYLDKKSFNIKLQKIADLLLMRKIKIIYETSFFEYYSKDMLD